ncbi:hypothetical protein KC678_04790 [Candidatus Dojkabacteria bacterium]|uniref:F420-0--gamma-glutamyl ligase n=1 Tax=Candidatus Dojkabacteria bacterium TaxID=2099670 RepID=A0A955L2K2_9BACT|nr:hypothetical protein [Candidatus Dojkabacteria bacterium]
MNSNPGRELYTELNGKKFARIPVETKFVEIDDSLVDVLDEFAKPKIENGDIMAVSCKIVSITTPGLTVHKDSVKISLLARIIVKFVKKWPNDIGYSSPRKMQVAINRAGYGRIIFSIIGGLLMKLLGKPGYFYRLAGNQINAIDGFTVGYTSKPIFENYAFLPPRPYEAKNICNELEARYGVPVAIMDGNNIENNVMGMSNKLENMYSEEEWKQIMAGNPQGQEDDGNNTPVILVREIK